MAQNYLYDVFISYRRRSPVGDWVRNHFYPLVSDWLPQVMPYNPKIFIDFDEIETGQDWPLRLQQALGGSKCLLAVWSADYFRSAWCVAEWKSMMQRESILGLRTADNPLGLIYPVVFFDGEHFPEAARRLQQRDLSRWSNPYPSFKDTQDYLALTAEVKEVAADLWGIVKVVPPWQPDWPLELPEMIPTPVQMNLPRLQ